jgi:hypothetical protein
MAAPTRRDLAVTARNVICENETYHLPGGGIAYVQFAKHTIAREFEERCIALGWFEPIPPGATILRDERDVYVDQLVTRALQHTEGKGGQTRRTWLSIKVGGTWLYQRATHIPLHQLYTIKSDYERRAQQNQARADGVYAAIRELEDVREQLDLDDRITLSSIGSMSTAV